MKTLNYKQLMFDKGINQVRLSEILSVSQPMVSKIIKGERSLQQHHIDALIEEFGEDVVNSYYTHQNLETPQAHEATVTIFNPVTIEEIKEELIEVVRAEEIKKTIVLTPDIIRDPDIDIKAEYKKGNLDEYAKPTQDIVPANHIKVYTYCDDMEPEIRAGEPVLVQLLPAGISIVPGQMYFIDLPSGGIIRYIEKEVDGVIYLKARNNNYGDIAVHREEVQSLSLVRLIMRTPRAMSMKESTATELLVNKDRHLDRLLDQLEKGGERERQLIDYITKER